IGGVVVAVAGDTDAPNIYPGADETFDDEVDFDCDGANGIELSELMAGEMLITEVMINADIFQSGSAEDGEWVEIYNNSGEQVRINGMTVTVTNTSSGSATSDTIPSDATDPDVVVGVDEYIVFVRTDENGISSEVSVYNYDEAFGFSNSSERQISVSEGTTTFDDITYDSTWPYAGDVAMSLSSDLYLPDVEGTRADDTVNDDFEDATSGDPFWCEATGAYYTDTDDADGDEDTTETILGSPGVDNPVCE
ncbi:MAG: hypothetical protein AAFV53_23710, partial [Myxococcota bacterium]